MLFLSKQLRKPSGLFGRFFLPRFFDRGNADLDRLVYDKLALESGDHTLEVGFGAGNLLHQIATTCVNGTVEGAEISDAMIKIARKRNKHFIRQGRINLTKASIEELPYPAANFNKVCSNNTLYFWPSPLENAKELLRVLKPGGMAVIGFRDKTTLETLPIEQSVFTFYEKSDVKSLLEAAGFEEVIIIERDAKPIPSMCAIARKAD